MSSNVTVRNVNKFGKKLNNEAMIRLFKKKVEKMGIVKEMRDREAYVKPSDARKLKSKMARLRVMKDAAKKAAREAKYNQDK